MNVVVIGAGPAGVVAAVRATQLGARTKLFSRDRFGGMAANDGPVPVRALAHAARLVRDARQLRDYGIAAVEPRVDYAALLERVRAVVAEVGRNSALRGQADETGVEVVEQAGNVRFVDAHTVATASGAMHQADRFILATGAVHRRLDVPGAELVTTHSGAWSLAALPRSLIVIGGGMTGLQVAWIFRAFGVDVQLFQSGPRILRTEDEDVARAVAAGLRASGIAVREGFGRIERFEKTPGGVRMLFSKDGTQATAEAALAIAAIGTRADLDGLNLAAAGVEVNARGFVNTDESLRTTAPHIFAAGDVTGRSAIVPPAMSDGYLAASNAVLGGSVRRAAQTAPIAGFTEPEYGSLGLTEAGARAAHDVVVATIRFDETTRTIIDGRTAGFCKLIADRTTRRILGFHVVGERAADLVQAMALAVAAGQRVDELARVPLAFPTHVGVLTRVAYRATQQIEGGAERSPLDQA